MRAYPNRYSPKLGVAAVRPQAAPHGMQSRPGRDARERCCFTVQCGEVSHVLAADSPELAARWMEKINRAWLHYTSCSVRRLTTSAEGERRRHEAETLRADVARFSSEAREARKEAAEREEMLRAEVNEATEKVKRMEALVNDRTRYTVWVHTGALKGANTSANVTVKLVGSHDRSSGDIPLEASEGVHGVQLFDQGVTSKFSFECGHLGEISSILLGHDGAGYHPSWYVECVKVRCDRDKVTWRFPIGKWFDADDHDGVTYRQITAAPMRMSEGDSRSSNVYLVTTYTSDLKGAGTDANVALVIHGAKGDTGTLRLTKGRDDFARGMRDQFVVEGPDVGDVRSVVIGHDNSGHGPSWHLQQLEILSENHGGRITAFPCNQWFDAEYGDFQTRRTLYPDDPQNPRLVRNMVRHSVVVRTSDVPGGGTDSCVSLIFNGDRGVSGPHELSRGKDDFTRGATDEFVVDVEEMGEIVSVVLSRDGRGQSPSWHLDHLIVFNQTTGDEYYFVHRGWIEDEKGAEYGVSVKLNSMTKAQFASMPQVSAAPGGGKGPALTSETVGKVHVPLTTNGSSYSTGLASKYNILLRTADVRGAGTDATCLIEINGIRDGIFVSSGPMELRNDSQSAFERGAVDSFVVDGPDVDFLTHISLGHSSAAPGNGWRPLSVELRGIRPEHSVTFVHDAVIPVEGKGVSMVCLAPEQVSESRSSRPSDKPVESILAVHASPVRTTPASSSARDDINKPLFVHEFPTSTSTTEEILIAGSDGSDHKILTETHLPRDEPRRVSKPEEIQSAATTGLNSLLKSSPVAPAHNSPSVEERTASSDVNDFVAGRGGADVLPAVADPVARRGAFGSPQTLTGLS